MGQQSCRPTSSLLYFPGPIATLPSVLLSPLILIFPTEAQELKHQTFKRILIKKKNHPILTTVTDTNEPLKKDNN